MTAWAPAHEAQDARVESPSLGRGLLAAVERWTSRPWVSYLAVFLVQLKVVWGAWIYRDLTAGDTGAYFISAENWFRDHTVNFAWSPLYTIVYGTLVGLTPGDAYLPTIAVRLVSVFTATLLVLAVMRRLLTPGLALLVGVWWAVLPVAYETMYEVHLFGALPVLLCWTVILGGKGAGRRGAALAILAAGAVLVRNELGVGALTLAAFCVLGEVRARRRPGSGQPPRAAHLALAYGLPMLLAAGACWAVYSRSSLQFPELWVASRPKHTVNMCQVFAFGYQQRHPEWTRSPWTDCGLLAREHFGTELPTIRQMLRRNPRAMATHFAWNARLAGNGAQMLLFAAISGSVSPDYVPVPSRSTRATVLSILGVALLVAGAVTVLRGPPHGLRRFLADRAWGWVAILAMVPAWVAVILTQRPRPSYLLPLGAALMAALGTSVLVTVWTPLTRRLGRVGPAALVAAVTGLLLWWPSHYAPAGQPLLTLYRRLLPFKDGIARPDTVLLVSSRPLEVRYYLGRGVATALHYEQVAARDGRDVDAFLDAAGVNLFYADEAMLETLRRGSRFHPFLDSMQAGEWTLIGGENHGSVRWRLWRRPPPARP